MFWRAAGQCCYLCTHGQACHWQTVYSSDHKTNCCLSWPSWLTCSGWFTHISSHPSAAGRAHDRESSPARDRRSTNCATPPATTWQTAINWLEGMKTGSVHLADQGQRGGRQSSPTSTLHTHAFNGPLSGTTRVSSYQKGKPNWILLEQETVSGSGINWAICKSAPRSRQITMPAPHHSIFYRPDALPAAQPTASKHWRQSTSTLQQTIIQCRLEVWFNCPQVTCWVMRVYRYTPCTIKMELVLSPS